jgi:hypothetical protein
MPKKRNSKSRTRSNKSQTDSRKTELAMPPRGAGRASLPKSLLDLQSPSAQARSRWHAIPLLFEDAGSSRQISGRIGFDSWAGRAVGLRDIDDGHVRHLQFEAGSTKIELVAERKQKGWDFVARVYVKAAVAHEFVIEAGRKRILPQSDGFYLWTSASLLRNLRLISLDRQIVIGGITW